MGVRPTKARDGADLQIGDTVRYEGFLYQVNGEPIDGIIVAISQLPDFNMYHIFNCRPNSITSDSIIESRIRERINTDYRGIVGSQILALHGVGRIET